MTTTRYVQGGAQLTANRPSVWRVWAGRIGLALLLGGLAWAAWRTHRPGHYWGDDFALYLRQARSLLGDQSVSDVIADNRFMLDHSYRTDFSPPVYPWGWPIMLSIPVAMVGLDVDRLMILSLALFVGSLYLWYRFAAGRIGRILALLGMVLIGTSPIYIDWTEHLHSELPYMVFAFATLVILDRTRGRWTASWHGGAVVGLLAAVAFSVRREGIALVMAIGVAQLADGVFRDPKVRWRAVMPAVAFVVFLGVLQLLLPSTLIPRYPQNSLANVIRFGGTYSQRIGEMIGLDMSVVGWMLISFGLGGWALAIRIDWRRHLPGVAFLVFVMAIGGSFFIPAGRYFSTAVPLLILGALMIPGSLARDSGAKRSLLIASTILVVAPLIWSNGVKAFQEAETADHLNPAVKEGPNRADAVEMFEAVKRSTDADTVVGFFKARAMTLYTDRRAVQVKEADPFNPESQFDALVVRIDELSDDDRAELDRSFDVEWSNETFKLVRRSD
jgi:hypothetical protein